MRRRCLRPRLLALTLELGMATNSPVEQVTTSEQAKRGKKGEGKSKGGEKSPVSNGAVSHSSNNGVQSNGVKSPPVEEMRQLVEEYAGTLGLDKKAWEKPGLGLTSQREQDSVEALTLAVFATTLRVMKAKEILAGKGGDSGEGSEAAGELLETFLAVFVLVCFRSCVWDVGSLELLTRRHPLFSHVESRIPRVSHKSGTFVDYRFWCLPCDKAATFHSLSSFATIPIPFFPCSLVAGLLPVASAVADHVGAELDVTVLLILAAR